MAIAGAVGTGPSNVIRPLNTEPPAVSTAVAGRGVAAAIPALTGELLVSVSEETRAKRNKPTYRRMGNS